MRAWPRSSPRPAVHIPARALAWVLLASLAASPAAQEAPPAPAPAPASEVDTVATQEAPQERPPAVVVTVVYEGNEALSSRTLRRGIPDPLVDIQERGAHPADVDDAAYQLTLLYWERGFPNAQVTWTIDDLEAEANQKLVTFRVFEGPRVVIGGFEFTGNEAFPDETLAAAYSAPASGILGGGPKLFVRSRVDALADAVVGLYRLDGYAEIRVSSPVVTFSEDGKQAFLEIEVVEGPVYLVSEVTFSGNELLGDEAFEEALAPLIGVRFRRRSLAEVRARLENTLADHGFPDATVEVEETTRTDEGQVSFTAMLHEGPLVRIGQIVIKGSEETDEDFILERIPFQSGDIWNGKVQRDVSRRLISTGLFRSVDITLAGEGDVRDFVVTVEDSNSIELYVKPGYGSYEKGRLSVGVRESNLWGSGRTANVEVGASTKGEFAEATLSDPWVLGENVVMSVPYRYRRREEPSFNYRERSIGLQARKRWTRETSTTVGTEYRWANVTNVDADVDEDLKEGTRIASVFAQVRHDRRDQIFNPTQGHLSRALVEYAPPVLAADLEFVRLEGSTAHFISLTDQIVLAASARTGMIIPAHSTDEIPLQERYFNGGENSVRSFKHWDLGPKDEDEDPVGGEVASTLNLEARYNHTQAWQTALFYDYGNVGLETSDLFDDFRSGVGGGVRYLLPVGSIRFDVGWNPSRRDDEDAWVAHLSIGMAF